MPRCHFKRKNHRKLLSASLLGATALYLLPSGPAWAENNWLGITSTDWDTATNWSDSVPDAAATVVVDTDSPNAAVVDGVAATAESLTVGYLGTSSLAVLNGGTITDTLGYIGSGVNGNGAVTVSGPGSTWTNSLGLIVGFYGTGELAISNGGIVTSDTAAIGLDTGSEGVATIEGASSIWSTNGDFHVGHSGAGTLTIASGGSVESGDGYIGTSTSGTGTVMVSGSGSSWTSNVILVGNSGTGELTISNSGQVVSASTAIGYNADSTSTATVIGSGSVWTNTGNFLVAKSGVGTLNISDGGTVTNTVGLSIVGLDQDSVGIVTVSGSGSAWNSSSDLNVGYLGTGTINVSDGGTVTSDTGFIGLNSGSEGSVTVSGSGSTWTNTGNLNVGFEGAGTLAFSGAGSTGTVAGDLFVGKSGTGMVTLLDGSILSTIGKASIGDELGSIGTVSIAGSAKWNTDGVIYTGYNGNGSISVSDAGQMSSAAVIVGAFEGSTGTLDITGPSSSAEITNSLFVGFEGAGTASVSNGGALTAASISAGYSPGSNGVLRITGAETTVNLDVLVAASQGDATVSVSEGATLSANQITLATQAGSTGTLNIGTAANETAVAAGIVNVGNIVFGDGVGRIILNHTDTDYELTSKISGAGSIQVYSGTTTLSGNSTYNGGTTVDGGTLLVDGSIIGAVSLNTGAILGGSGTVGDVTAGSGATLAPGNSIGTLHVASAAFDEGSTYAVEVNADGNADLIEATGIVAINGGLVEISPIADFVVDTNYTIITAEGGINGTFDALNFEINSLFLTPTLSYDANNVYFNLGKTSFASVAMTPNQIAAANGADSLLPGNSLFGAILVLGGASEAEVAFDAISGEIHASTGAALVNDSRYVREAANDRILSSFGSVGSKQGARVEPGWWIEGFGAHGQTDSNGNAAKLKRSVGGLFIGADGAFGNWNLGVLAGYDQSDFDTEDRASSGTADNYHLGAYGGTKWDNLGFRFGGIHTWHDLDIGRVVAFTGFATPLSSSYKAGTDQVFAELGYGLDAQSVRYEPFANIAHVHYTADGFTESGNAAALTGKSGSISTTFTTLGIRGETELKMGEGAGRLTGMLGWSHALGDTTPDQTVVFSGGSPFAISGAPITRNALAVRTGIDYGISPMATFSFDYSGQIASDASDHGIKARLAIRF